MVNPFFASLLLGMEIIEDKSVKTLATNGEYIKFNPEYLATLTLAETEFVLAHETMHAVFQHMHRRGAKDLGKWNKATDYIVNDLLVSERIGVMPKGALYDPKLVLEGKTAEGVYNLLPEESGDNSPGDPGSSLDTLDDAGKDESEIAEKEAEMKVKVAQAMQAAKNQGKLSAGMARLAKELIKTQANWKYILRRFMTERAKNEVSYARPKRRWLAEDMILPGLSGEQMGVVCVAVDCSGSIGQRELDVFATEIKGIIQDTMPMSVHVIYFDSEVSHVDTFNKDESVDIKPHGGGGTAFSPIFKHIEDNELNPVCTVVLTDLCCDDFGPEPSYPVLWASTQANATAPFGEITVIKT